MGSLIDSLRRRPVGACAVLGLAAAAAGSAAALLASRDALVGILVLVALVLAAAAATLVAAVVAPLPAAARELRRSVDAVAACVEKTEKHASRAAYFGESGAGVTGTVVNANDGVRELLREVRELRDELRAVAQDAGRTAAGDELGAGRPVAQAAPAQPLDVRDPRLVTSYRAGDVAKRSVPGRAAAIVEGDPRSPAKLAALLAAPAERQRVAMLAGSPVAERLGDGYEIVPIFQGEVHPGVLDGVSALVIDLGAFARGPWYGVDTVLGTRALNELLEFAKAARKRLLSVLVVADDRGPAHFTSELARVADLVVDDGDFGMRWAPDRGTALLRDLRSARSCGASRANAPSRLTVANEGSAA